LIWVNKAMQDNHQDAEQLQETGPKSVPFASISKVKHIQSDGVYIKSTFVPRNIKFYSKRTPDSHVAILAAGELLMEDGEHRTRFVAPANYIIPANSRIAFYTLSDCVFYCVHATDEKEISELDRIY
jgi:hypothetical protein